GPAPARAPAPAPGRRRARAAAPRRTACRLASTRSASSYKLTKPVADEARGAAEPVELEGEHQGAGLPAPQSLAGQRQGGAGAAAGRHPHRHPLVVGGGATARLERREREGVVHV